MALAALDRMAKATRARPRREYERWVMRELFPQPDWPERITVEHEEKCARAAAGGLTAPLKLHTTSSFLQARFDEADEATQDAVRAVVAERNDARQADFDATLDMDTQTPEECAKYVFDSIQ